MLDELNNIVAPMYHTKHYEDPTLDEYYVTRVHIRVDDGRRGRRTVSVHNSSTPMTTYRHTVSSAAGGLSGLSTTPTAGIWRTQITSIFLAVLVGLRTQS